MPADFGRTGLTVGAEYVSLPSDTDVAPPLRGLSADVEIILFNPHDGHGAVIDHIATKLAAVGAPQSLP